MLVSSLVVSTDQIKTVFQYNFFIILNSTVWRSYSHPCLPARDGISAGLNEFGRHSYVGRGTYEGQLAPGKLMTEPNGYAAGLYFAYGDNEIVITSEVEYYAKEPPCDYRWVPSSNGQIVSNAIQLTSHPYTFYVGRIHTFDSIQVGKVTLEHRVMYYAFNGRSHRTANYEVLTCVRITQANCPA